MRRDSSATEVWPGYGLIAGAAIGVLLLALTGWVLWLAFLPAFGLVVGAITGQVLDDRTGRHDRAGKR